MGLENQRSRHFSTMASRAVVAEHVAARETAPKFDHLAVFGAVKGRHSRMTKGQLRSRGLGRLHNRNVGRGPPCRSENGSFFPPFGSCLSGRAKAVDKYLD